MANYTPFGLALSMQREAIRQGQRTVEQSMAAQRTMAEAFVHNAIGMGRATNRNATEATRQGMVTVAGMMDAMTPASADTAAAVDRGFDSMASAQENAWHVFEESVEDGLATYGQLAQSGMGVFSQSVDATVAAHEEAGRRSADAAVEYERQRPEDHATSGRGGNVSGSEESAATSAEPVTIEPEEASEPSVETGEPVTDAGEPAAEADESTADAGEAVADAGESATGPGLEELSGVGSAYAERLRAAGIDSVEALQDADVAELSAETEISDERLSNWQRQVRHMLDESE